MMKRITHLLLALFTLSVLGGSQTTYMSEESLYLASVEYTGDADGDQFLGHSRQTSVHHGMIQKLHIVPIALGIPEGERLVDVF